MTSTIRIAKQDKLFTRLRWACLAVVRHNSTRPALELLCVDTKGERLQFTGCDGNRIHRFINDSDPRFKDTDRNLYAISKITKSELCLIKSECKEPYPDVDKFLLKNSNAAKSVDFTYGYGTASISVVYAAAIRLLKPNWTLNMTLFAELFSDNIAEGKVTMKLFDNFVVFEAVNLLGLLMLLEIKNIALIIEEHKESTNGSDLLD